MAKQHTTIHDIARELNVAASTVSRALQDHPRISEATRKAVRDLAEKYNYRPNVVATSLRKGKSKTVGVIVPRINRNFFAHVIGGMEEFLAASGYNLMICQTHENLENEKAAIDTLMHARVDAILLSISMETSDTSHIRSLHRRGVPLFFFDRAAESIPCGSVVVNDRRGAYLSVTHLLEQGYSRIVHVAGSSKIPDYRNRKQGYLDAMQEAGIDVKADWIMEEPLIQSGGEAAFIKGMGWKKKAEAYFCAGDFAALGILQQARKAGISVPRDLGITGFDNEPFTAYLTPSLTTVDQRGWEMGYKVAEMFLHAEQAGAQGSPCEKLVLEPELIVRESSLR